MERSEFLGKRLEYFIRKQKEIDPPVKMYNYEIGFPYFVPHHKYLLKDTRPTNRTINRIWSGIFFKNNKSK